MDTSVISEFKPHLKGSCFALIAQYSGWFQEQIWTVSLVSSSPIKGFRCALVAQY